MVAVALIALIAALNVGGTRQSAGVQNVSTGIKAGAIVVMSMALIVAGRGYSAAPAAWPDDASPALLSGIGLAMISVLWAYEGWQYVTFAAGEARDAQRTFPRAIVAGTGVLIAIYMLANVAYVSALGVEGVQATDRVAATAVSALFGPAAAKLIAAVILVSMFSAANGLTLTAPRMYYAMARDGVFFRKLGEVHPRFGTPAFAIVAGSLWAMVLAATGTFNQLLTYVVFSGWIFYGLGALSIFAFRRREPDAPRPFRVPGYPLTPILFVAASAAIVLNTVFTQPRNAMYGIAGVLTGVPAYFLWRHFAGRVAGVAAES
jgi:APA family basic amino acid/polyamine antiporter